MNKNTLLLLLFCFSSGILYSQNNLLNEAKYWVWRDRLLNDFMIPDTCTGCGIVFNKRGTNDWNCYPPDCPPQVDWVKGGFDISDEGFQMGKYLVALASEWKLLRNSGLSTEKTEIELYYELKTIERLDKVAEKYWTPYILHYPNGTPYPNGLINGFMIRNDVFDNFLWYNDNLPNATYNIDAYNRYLYLNQDADGKRGKYQKQNIMKSNYNPSDGSGSNIYSLPQMNEIIRYYDPNCDGYPNNGGFSAAEAGLHATESHSYPVHKIPLECIGGDMSLAWLPENHDVNITGPEEYSQDNYIGLLMGLATVQSLVENIYVQNPNGSGGIYIKVTTNGKTTVQND